MQNICRAIISHCVANCPFSRPDTCDSLYAKTHQTCRQTHEETNSKQKVPGTQAKTIIPPTPNHRTEHNGNARTYNENHQTSTWIGAPGQTGKTRRACLLMAFPLQTEIVRPHRHPVSAHATSHSLHSIPPVICMPMYWINIATGSVQHDGQTEERNACADG